MTAPTLDELVAMASTTPGEAIDVLTDLTGLSPDLAAAMLHHHEQAHQSDTEPSDDWAWE